MNKTISLPNGARIGGDAPCFVIAEAGVNHNGDLGLAAKLVDVAAEAGADAVKFQSFDPSLLASADAPKAEYQKRAVGSEASQLDMLRALTLSREAHVHLKAHAEQRGILFFSSPFDEPSAELLFDLGVPALKIPSGELTNHALLAKLARMGKPLLVSTGMSTLEEVDAAMRVFAANGDPPIALFHCVSNYPADPADANLRAMETMRARFGVPVGWSDHTEGVDVSIAAAALGAELLEKHITLDRTMPGPDHAASLEPDELTALVRGVRRARAALGSGVKEPRASEAAIAAVARKSLHFKRDLKRGARLVHADLIALRPGTGISPARAEALVGRALARDVAAGAIAREEDFEAHG